MKQSGSYLKFRKSVEPMTYLFFFSFSLLKIILFIYFLLYWVFVAVQAFSLIVASRGYSPVVVCRLLTAVPFLV